MCMMSQKTVIYHDIYIVLPRSSSEYLPSIHIYFRQTAFLYRYNFITCQVRSSSGSSYIHHFARFFNTFPHVDYIGSRAMKPRQTTFISCLAYKLSPFTFSGSQKLRVFLLMPSSLGNEVVKLKGRSYINGTTQPKTTIPGLSLFTNITI